MPDSLDEWIRLVSYISGVIGGSVMIYGMWGKANEYWDLFYKDENDEDE